MPGLTKEQIQTFFDKRHSKNTSPLRIEKTYEKGARLRLVVEPHHLRHGDTVSGPALMTLVDAAVFVAILVEIGPVFQAVTTNLNINFLKKAEAADVIAECRLLKVGRRLVFAEVDLFSEDNDELVAHATCTYSIPSQTIKNTK
ncbi:MAG: PaaI family thioesterase [bacterium]